VWERSEVFTERHPDDGLRETKKRDFLKKLEARVKCNLSPDIFPVKR